MHVPGAIHPSPASANAAVMLQSLLSPFLCILSFISLNYLTPCKALRNYDPVMWLIKEQVTHSGCASQRFVWEVPNVLLSHLFSLNKFDFTLNPIACSANREFKHSHSQGSLPKALPRKLQGIWFHPLGSSMVQGHLNREPLLSGGHTFDPSTNSLSTWLHWCGSQKILNS